MAKVTNVKEMHQLLETLIKEGKGDYPIYFDAEARKFDYHMVKIGSVHTLDLGADWEMVTLHEER